MANRLPVLLLLGIAACAPPPPPPETTLAATADTVLVPAVEASTIVPRSDGKWVVLDPVDNQLFVADFAAHASVVYPKVTKTDVPHPITLIAVGDSIIVGDWGLKRFTEWTPAGDRLAAWPAPDTLRNALPRARDAAGQWYFKLTPDAKVDGSGLLDSAAIVRGDPQLTRFDTIGRLAPPELVQVSGLSGMHYQRRTMGGEDAWGVRPDGTLWIARVFQNQVEWHRPGTKKVERSPMLPDQVLTVSEMDRELWVRHFPEDQRDDARQLPNSPVKPPFEHVFAAPDERMWLGKSDTALATVRHVQLVDRRGVVLNVGVPSRGTLLGVDANYLVMAEEFPGGIRLLRYPLPAVPAPKTK